MNHGPRRSMSLPLIGVLRSQSSNPTYAILRRGGFSDKFPPPGDLQRSGLLLHSVEIVEDGRSFFIAL